MNRLVAIAAVAGLLVGVLVGFLWWGLPVERREAGLAEARKRAEVLERQVNEVQAQTRTVQAELKSAQERLTALTEDLRLERNRRSQLEMMLSRGRK